VRDSPVDSVSRIGRIEVVKRSNHARIAVALAKDLDKKAPSL
jgi:hypothetical protein